MPERRQKPFSRDVIKYAAVFAMLLNHISFIFLDQESFLGILFTDIGYFTGITMIWLLVEGYTYTRSRKKYAQRLLFFAVISELPFCLAFTKGQLFCFYGWNMLFTLFVCFLIVYIMMSWQTSTKKTVVLLLLVLCTWNSDWGILGPVYAILFARAGDDRRQQESAWRKAIWLFGMVNLLSAAEQYPAWKAIMYTIGTMAAPMLAAVGILYFYNGRNNRDNRFSKWFFYAFYPGHLLILGLLRVFMGL